MALMSSKERLHIEAHSGQHHLWVTQLPLTFKKYALTSPEWTVATRKRLMIDVFPFQSHCKFCKGGWCDVKGEHAIMCAGGHSRVFRHNNSRDIIARAARDVGLKTDLEHGGGLRDQRRPGDVIIYNWRDDRHLLIDVAVINPLCSTNLSNLISDGVGAAATAYEKIKVKTYSDLDFTKYEFLPFIIEATGGMGKAAHGFCKELKNRRASLKCNSEDDGICRWSGQDPLIMALSVELQRANSRMVLERTPQSGNLIASEIAKCQHSVAIRRKQAIENLRLESIKPDRIMNRDTFRARECKSERSSSVKVSTVGREFVRTKPPISESQDSAPRSLWDWRRLWDGARHSGSGAKMWKQHDLPPTPVPDPPDVIQETSSKGVSLPGALEERTSALESYQSRCTSTFEASSRQTSSSSSKSELKAASWEPPDARTGKLLQSHIT